MKVRLGFVSNSSSSSFIVSINRFSKEDLSTISLTANEEGWSVCICDNRIRFHTCMDNFDLFKFLNENYNLKKNELLKTWHSNDC